METLKIILLVFLILCALSVCVTRRLLTSIIIFMSYSTVMAVIWVLLRSPDLAITEAAVGVGVTSILFFITLKKIHLLDENEKSREKEEAESHEP